MKLYGLIGFPLGHSFSKQYFTEKFSKEGLSDCFFEAYPIPSIDLFPALIKENPTLRGLSVTIPYKEQVLKFITEISEEVKFIGATNNASLRFRTNNAERMIVDSLGNILLLQFIKIHKSEIYDRYCFYFTINISF